MMAFTITDAGALAAVQAAGHPAIPAGQTTSLVLAAPAQAPQQAPPGATTATAGLIITLVIGFFLYQAIKSKKAKPSYTIAAFTAGVLLSGSMFGVMANQVAGSLGQGLATMFSTVTSNSGGRATAPQRRRGASPDRPPGP